jgi:hypothetical protein
MTGGHDLPMGSNVENASLKNRSENWHDAIRRLFDGGYFLDLHAPTPLGRCFAHPLTERERSVNQPLTKRKRTDNGSITK